MRPNPPDVQAWIDAERPEPPAPIGKILGIDSLACGCEIVVEDSRAYYTTQCAACAAREVDA